MTTWITKDDVLRRYPWIDHEVPFVPSCGVVHGSRCCIVFDYALGKCHGVLAVEGRTVAGMTLGLTYDDARALAARGATADATALAKTFRTPDEAELHVGARMAEFVADNPGVPPLTIALMVARRLGIPDRAAPGMVATYKRYIAQRPHAS